MEKLKISLTVISSIVFLQISFSTPENIVILSFISWSIIVFTSAYIIKLNGGSAGIYWLTASIDGSSGIIAYFMGVPLGFPIEYVILFLVGIFTMIVVIIYGKKYEFFCLIVTLILTILSHIPVILYYWGDNKADSLYLSAVGISMVVLFIQLFSSEIFISEVKKDWKKGLAQSSITLLWIVLTTIELPMIIQ